MNDLLRQIKKRKRNSVVASILLLVIFLIGGTIAYFSSSLNIDNIFHTAVYKTVTTEILKVLIIGYQEKQYLKLFLLQMKEQ